MKNTRESFAGSTPRRIQKLERLSGNPDSHSKKTLRLAPTRLSANAALCRIDASRRLQAEHHAEKEIA